MAKVGFQLPRSTTQALQMRWGLPATKAVKAELGFKNVQVYEEEEAEERGLMGLPVWLPVTLEEVRYSDFDGDTRVKRILPEMKLGCAVAQISLAKIIIKTPVEGRDGSFKESIAADDWSVRIKGIFGTDDGTYPYDMVERLALFANAPVAISVTSKLLNRLGIYMLVVENLNFPDPSPSYQGFNLSCSSDDPIELELKKDSARLTT